VILILAAVGCGGATQDNGTATAGGAGAPGAQSGGGGSAGGSAGGSQADAAAGGAAPTTHDAGVGDAGVDVGAGADVDAGPPIVERRCPGVPAPPYPILCRDGANCAKGYGCYLDPPPVCVGCGRPPDMTCPSVRDKPCGADTDCPDASFCLTVQDSPVSGTCTCPSVRVCKPTCTALSCGYDQRCGAAGICEPRPCNDDAGGYTCASGQKCAPGEPRADSHGCRFSRCDVDAVTCPVNFRCDPTSEAGNACVRKACAQDGDCDCGVCASSVCQDHNLFCAPVPYYCY
jgi:hypothetical protein